MKQQLGLSQRRSRRGHSRVLSWVGTALCAAGMAAAPAQAQNLGNLLQFVRPAQPAAPSGAAQAVDLIALLNQAGTQIDEPKEIEIGRQLAAVLLGSKPLHPDASLQRYVNQIGRWISLQTSRPNLPWTFAVLDDPGFNAFATPGGFVFVTKGLIDQLADESELAGILAHEITHVIQRHHLMALRKNAQAGAVAQVGASVLSRQIGGAGGALASQFVGLARNMYSKGLDQTDEFESDRQGVALAASAGFDPYGLLAVLQRLRSASADNPLFTLTLSTHPPAQARMDQVEQAMGNRLDAMAGKPVVTVPQRLAQVAAEGATQLAAAPVAGNRPGAGAPALPAMASSLAPATANAGPGAAGDVFVPKVAGVKAYRDASEARELTTLARTDEVVFEGAEKDGFMRVVTPRGTGWVKAIMLRKP
jgi:predicted Zn-dependent protease